ncbi:MAG: PQQ-binding-like beta-propeller repeat protein, partial [Nitrososphaera sp.]
MAKGSPNQVGSEKLSLEMRLVGESHESRIRHTLLVVVSLALVLIALLAACSGAISEVKINRAGTPTPSPKRLIVENSLPFSEMWRKTSIQVGLVSANSPSIGALSAAKDIVYVVDFNPPASDHPSTPWSPWIVIALNAKTGAELWKTEQLGLIDSLATDPRSLYVASESGIRAYYSGDGSLKWISNQPPPDHEGYYIFLGEHQLRLFIVRGGRLVNHCSTIDLESGFVGEIQECDGLVAFDSESRYMRNDKEFWLEDSATGKVIWKVPMIGKGRNNWPIISSDFLIIPSMSSNFGWHSVTVIDRNRGQKVWECFDCYASDIAVDKDMMYAISRDGSLSAYNVKTGQAIGTIRFSGGDKIDPNTTRYALATATGN